MLTMYEWLRRITEMYEANTVILLGIIGVVLCLINWSLKDVIRELREINKINREIKDKQTPTQSIPYNPSEDLTSFNKPKHRTMRD